MTIKPHTCSEWLGEGDEICGKPAAFHLKVENPEDGTTITNWKCSIHIRRYHRHQRDSKIRITITAYKEKTNGKPRRSRPTPQVGQRTRSRK